MKIETIVVKVSLEDDNTDTIASATCLIDARDISRVKASDITDACQRAVAHCVEELKNSLDN